jgi:hypothetical protein
VAGRKASFGGEGARTTGRAESSFWLPVQSTPAQPEATFVDPGQGELERRA